MNSAGNSTVSQIIKAAKFAVVSICTLFCFCTSCRRNLLCNFWCKKLLYNWYLYYAFNKL